MQLVTALLLCLCRAGRLNHPRADCCAAAVGDKLYVAGGWTTDYSDTLGSVEVFDPAAAGGAWSFAPNMTLPRGDCEAVMLDDRWGGGGSSASAVINMRHRPDMWDGARHSNSCRLQQCQRCSAYGTLVKQADALHMFLCDCVTVCVLGCVCLHSQLRLTVAWVPLLCSLSQNCVWVCLAGL